MQYWNTLDSQAIGSVELVKSQGSVLYGSDAIGGTVNVLGKEPEFRSRQVGEAYCSGSAYYRFDTNSESHYGRVEHELGKGGEWGLLLGLSAKDSGDIRDSAVGRMERTGYSEQSLDLKFQYALSDSATFTFSHNSLNQDDITRWHSTVYNPGWTHGSHRADAGTDLARSYDQERSLTYARIVQENAALGWLQGWSATLSYQGTQDSENRIRGNGRNDLKVLDIQTLGINLEGNSNLSGGTLVWGADYYHDAVDSSGYRNGVVHPANRPVADDSTYDSLGIFGLWEKALGERFEYGAGARYTYAKATWDGYRPAGAARGDLAGSGSWDDLSMSLRGLYKLDGGYMVYGGLSQAFRAPNLDDLTGSQFALNGLDANGSPDISPEKYLTAELGTRYKADKLRVDVSGYHTWVDDAITRVDDGMGGLATVNGQNGYVYGFEAEVTWNVQPDWELGAYAAWQDGKGTAPSSLGGQPVEDTLRRMHPLTASLALKWTHPSEKFWLQGRIIASGTQDNLSSLAASDLQRIPSGGTPSYVVASLYGGWQATENLSLNCALENITDEDYRHHGSGQNAPGINLTVGAKVTW